jgi:hypothetical protein
MLRRIRTEFPLPVIDGVLIKRTSLRNGADGANLIDAARKRARQIVDSATSEAEAIRRQACATGYREGFGEALNTLAAWTHQHDAFCTGAALQLRGEVEARLSRALLDVPVVTHIVDAVFGSTSIWQAQRVRVRLPAIIADHAAYLTQAVEQAGGAALEILPSEDNRLTIECGNHVFIFDVDALVQLTDKVERRPRTDIEFGVLKTQANSKK